MSILSDIISALGDALGVPVVALVPPERPGLFVTVERTGGASTRFIDAGQYAVQAWAASMLEAETLMTRVREAVWQLCRLPWVAFVQVGSCYNFPDPDGRQQRFQCVCEIHVMQDLGGEPDGETNEK